MTTAAPVPILTVIMVSYNTRDLTLAAIRTLLETTRETPMRVVVLDNASTDGSADAIAEHFPQVELIRSEENLGFARANNVVAEAAATEFLLLLNPDTECHEGAVDHLVRFARETPAAGIWGGRTVFPDGSLNIASCWMRITLWSVICRTFGLDTLFRCSEVFNPEAMGCWQRDSVRQVDIVVGCFLLIRRDLWHRLNGFDLKYFMYGEEADLCLRARALGCRPAITPRAEIMHIVGAAAGQRSDKRISVLRARATLLRDHWPAWQVPLGLGLMWLGAGLRRMVSRSAEHREIWAARRGWLAGY
jgi:GT2 family glycosyltransferase